MFVMKAKLLLLFLSFFFFVGCGTVKKTAVSGLAKVEETKDTSRDLDVSTLIDTTKIDGKVVSIVKVEFFPDSPPPVVTKEDPDSVRNSAPLVVDQPAKDQPRPTNTVSTKGTTISGSIKSAEIIEIEEETEHRGKTQTEITETAEETTVQKAETQSSETVTPEKDPRRFLWLAILIAVSLIALLVVYVKFIKPLNLGGWISKILGKFGGLLKNN